MLLGGRQIFKERWTRMGRRTIAITGARGLLGARLIDRLEEDESCRRIVLLDLVPPKTRPRKGVFYRVDLTEPSATSRIVDALRQEQPSVFVHLAFLQHPTRDPGYARELEAVGTKRLIAALTEHEAPAGGLPLICASSTLVYGALADNPNFLGEDAPLRGRVEYPLVGEKIAAETLLRDFGDSQRRAVTVLRFAPILEAQPKSLVARYLSLPTVPTLLGFNPLVQLLGADDAVEALLRAVRVRPAGTRAFNVAGGGTVPLLAAIRLAGRSSVPTPWFVAVPLLDALFQAGGAIAPAAHLDYLRYLFVTDVERAAAELDFRARRSTREVALAFAAASVPNAA